MIDWDTYWSHDARYRQPAMLHSIVQRFSGLPDVVGLHGGLPPPDAFPLQSLTATAFGGATLQLPAGPELTAAQQYNLNAKGYPPLQSWAGELTRQLQRPASPVDLLITPGATAALDAITRLLLDPGDPLLVEEFTYSHALEALFVPARYELLTVPLDDQGLVPGALDDLMRGRQAAGLKLPRVLYTIPTGQNPTGVSVTPARRAAVYEVARRWGLVIVEDDAYFWLQWPTGAAHPPGLDLPAGYLSLDVDGRVVRVDTLAKLLGPGYRLGWVTGPPRLVAKAALLINATSIGAASFSQVLIHQLVTGWGRAGFEAFLRSVQVKYAAKAEAAAAAAATHLAGLVEVLPVTAGMFLWCRLTGVSDADAVLEAGVKEQVVVVPGKIFWAKAVTCPPPMPITTPASSNGNTASHKPAAAAANGSTPSADANGHSTPAAAAEGPSAPPCPYFRLSFASASQEQLQEGFRRLRAAICSCMDHHPAAPGATAAPAGAEGASRGPTAPTSPLHLSGRCSSDLPELPGPPWSAAAEGRLPVPHVLAEAAVALGQGGVGGNGEPLAPGVGDDGLTAAAEAAEQAAAAAAGQ